MKCESSLRYSRWFCFVENRYPSGGEGLFSAGLSSEREGIGVGARIPSR